MRNYLVTFTQDGEQRKDRTSEPMVFAMNLYRKAQDIGLSIEHLTFKKEVAAL